MKPELVNQQPIARVVGRRRSPPVGQVPSAEARLAMTKMAQYRTRAPKGVFIYASHEEMERDRQRWMVEAVLERVKQG